MRPQNGSQPDFEELYREYRLYVIRLCVLYLGDISSAEDAAQDTFYKVYKSLRGFAGRSDIRTWITRIAVNTCKDHLRRRKPTDELSDDIPQTYNCDNRLTVRWAVSQLSPKLREAVILYYYYELPQKEIAHILRSSPAAVAKRLERARTELRALLGEGFCE